MKGLRREEVAMLAGVSVDYYVRMERGSLSGASDTVLDALASALQLDDAERAIDHPGQRGAASRGVIGARGGRPISRTHVTSPVTTLGFGFGRWVRQPLRAVMEVPMLRLPLGPNPLLVGPATTRVEAYPRGLAD